MSYKRQTHFGYNSQYPTKVQIHWSQKSSAYAIKFMDTNHWDEMQIFIQYLKGIPYGERDYDPDTKTWYLMEKHIEGFKQMMLLVPQFFEFDFQAKPANQTYQGNFVSVDTYLDKFKEYTNTDIRTLDYLDAKKIYRRCALANHPDRGGDSKLMSEINECWSNIERLHFNIKKEPEYV